MFIQNRNFGHNGVIRCGRVDGVHNSGDHIHQYCEIEMIIGGEIEITVSGKKHIARAGDIAVIPPLKVHSFHTPKKVQMLICTLSSFFLPSAVSTEELMSEREAYVFHAAEPLWNYLIATDFYNIQTNQAFDNDADRELIHRLRASFHLILSEFVCSCAVSEGGGSDSALARILLYLSEHYTEEVTLSAVADALGYSPKYVSNCFAAIKGISFRQFINSLRIEDAKAQLATTDSTILSIALDCGFHNESSFHRIFRETVGMTPAAYREKKRRRG